MATPTTPKATTPNKLRWDLDSIFPGGSASTEFADFRNALTADLSQAKETLAELPRSIDDTSREKWIDYLALIQDLLERIDHASGFSSCLAAQDVKDDQALLIKEEISALLGQWEALLTAVEEAAAATEDAVWQMVVDDKQLSGATYFWNELRRNAKLKMAPELERLTVELSVNGYHAWDRLYSKIAGDLQAEFPDQGKIDVLSMGQLANKFSSPNRTIREAAFRKLEETWETATPITAMVLNSQAGFRLTVYENRGWKSPLFEPLLLNRLKEDTLEAMWGAVADGRDKMAEYIKAKKKVLKIDKFRWYDQIAPLGDVSRTYGYEEAGDFIVKHLSAFSEDMGSFARMAIDRRWIEAEDRSGKAAGGFCTGLDLKKESRIFMTFGGNYDEMMTLAHELGHAYHSWVLKDRDYFARNYPMNLAETASTFNELLVTDAALNASADDTEKLVLLDQKIQQGFVMFCNIRARYLFDSMFYRERKKGAVSKDRLNEMMVTAQKKAFGAILADDGYHPLFWASKLHFFITDMPFYNFPYTFGFLFAGGIYDRAQKEGSSFAEKYKALLADTGSMSTEEVAHKHLNVDLTQPAFWNDAVARVVSDIDPFIELAAKVYGN